MKTPNIAPMFYGAKPELFEFAKRMRHALTDSEKLMWQILKSQDFKEHKFRRQHPLGKSIADFYSHALLLVIEIDGGYHLQRHQKESDTLRDEHMVALGIRVARFKNEEVNEQPEQVKIKLKGIIDHCKIQTATPSVP